MTRQGSKKATSYKLQATSSKRIFLDYASGAPISKSASSAFLKVSERYGNPSSIHKEGVEMAKILDESRKNIARLFGSKQSEVFFTSGATEANNIAIMGRLKYMVDAGKDPNGLHAITTAIEHPSVLLCFKEMETMGVKVSYLPLDGNGFVKERELKETLRKETFLVSIQHSNGEIGVIQPIRRFCQIVKDFSGKNSVDIVFHSDCSQSAAYLSIRQSDILADIISADGRKIGAGGVGFLFIKHGVKIKPIMFGGEQESGLRPGTEDLPAIFGASSEVSVLIQEREKRNQKVSALRDLMIEIILKEVPDSSINGPIKDRLPNNVNVCIKGVDAEWLIISLDAKGFAVSAKSACQKEKRESYVLKAIGKTADEARSSIRISLGNENTRADVLMFVKTLKEVVVKGKNFY